MLSVIAVVCHLQFAGLGQTVEFEFTPAEASQFAAGYGLLNYQSKKFDNVVCSHINDVIDFISEEG